FEPLADQLKTPGRVPSQINSLSCHVLDAFKFPGPCSRIRYEAISPDVAGLDVPTPDNAAPLLPKNLKKRAQIAYHSTLADHAGRIREDFCPSFRRDELESTIDVAQGRVIATCPPVTESGRRLRQQCC